MKAHEVWLGYSMKMETSLFTGSAALGNVPRTAGVVIMVIKPVVG
jgi:hypothetical protein